MNMMSTDPIADMLTRIRNAIAINRSIVAMPHSVTKQRVAEVLKDSRFVSDVSVSGEKCFKTLTITINSENTNAKITEIERISKPGRRVYSQAKNIPKVKSGRGMVVISTSQGIMSGDAAKQAGLGGELICKVY
jgi:small subunit ribosomal protein S8